MTTSLTVPKILNYPPSMNYPLLRREGMKHLERLGSAIWTDFNSHDPGVTMLEVLCYALTDLGYRTQLPEADLFNGNNKAFFTAAQVLPNAPITALDFRKILIDIEGVKNAWLECYEKEDVLFQLKLERVATFNISLEANPLNLNPVNISFSLNTLTLAIPNPQDANQTISTVLDYLKIIFKLAKEGKKTQLSDIDKAFKKNLISSIKTQLDENGQKVWLLKYAENTVYKLDEIVAFCKKRVFTQNRFLLVNNLAELPNKIKVNDIAGATKLLNQCVDVVSKDEELTYFIFVEPLLRQLFSADSLTVEPINSLNSYSIFSPEGICQIYIQLEGGYEVEKEKIIAEAKKLLHQNRALCEDFAPEITVVDKAPIGICTTLELSAAADPIQVYAELLYAIETFLSPSVQMYGLQEMLDKYATFTLTTSTFEELIDAELAPEIIKNLESLQNKEYVGKSAWTKAVQSVIGDEAMQDYEGLIFTHTYKVYESSQVVEGPLLKHGFIDTTELEAANWKRTVYKSDLFQVLSKVESVARVTNLQIRKCNDEKDQGTQWCLSFDCHCQPTLDLECEHTCFHFTKNGCPVDFNDFMKYEALAKLEQLRNQTAKIDRSGELDLPVPMGVQRNDLQEYTSIQEEFPRTYHVGREGIVGSATSLQKAQVKQMKGFLMFFDQILANYLAQLARVRDILAIEKANNDSKPFQTLYDVPNVEPLFAHSHQEYENALSDLTEGSDITQKLRQNQITDHLLARFGEQFTDYALELFQIEQPIDGNIETTENANDWLQNKQFMLKNLPELSSSRGQGFNYQPELQKDDTHFWDSDNVEGFKRRVLAQLGIGNWQRRTISCSPAFYTDIKSETVNRVKRYRFGIKESEDAVNFWLLSSASYSKEEAANKAAESFFAMAADTQNYDTTSDGDSFFVGFWENNSSKRTIDNALLLSLPMSQSEAEVLLGNIKRYIEKQCQHESFHIIEHILLRPMDEHYTVLKPKTCAENLSQLDAYSFQITLLMPDWVDLFKNPTRYAHFEALLRSEVPAHVAMYFVKLNRNDMLTFEEDYYEWLRLKTDATTEAFDLRVATNKVIDFLNKI